MELYNNEYDIIMFNDDKIEILKEEEPVDIIDEPLEWLIDEAPDIYDINHPYDARVDYFNYLVNNEYTYEPLYVPRRFVYKVRGLQYNTILNNDRFDPCMFHNAN
tara:strand:- start:221 stop:535 length:315 start_codon:yes stop_codon:yes gene_type:complete